MHMYAWRVHNANLQPTGACMGLPPPARRPFCCRDFAPDTGTLSVYRHAQGYGIRIDGIGYSGMTVTPFYDSLLVKYIARASTWPLALSKMRRALLEMHIRGVKTNIPFLLNVLDHPEFVKGAVTTSFIDRNPQVLTTLRGGEGGGERGQELGAVRTGLGEGLRLSDRLGCAGSGRTLNAEALSFLARTCLLGPLFHRCAQQLTQVSGSAWAVRHYGSTQEKSTRSEKQLRYIAHLAVNGHPPSLGADPGPSHVLQLGNRSCSA